MKDIFEINAVWNEKNYHHFGIIPTLASMYGDDPKDIETIIMKVSDDQSIPEPNEKHEEADYWGWYEFEEKRFTNMIYAQRFLLDMCFPAGIKDTEESGQGKAYRLHVIEGDHKN